MSLFKKKDPHVEAHAEEHRVGVVDVETLAPPPEPEKMTPRGAALAAFAIACPVWDPQSKKAREIFESELHARLK